MEVPIVSPAATTELASAASAASALQRFSSASDHANAGTPTACAGATSAWRARRRSATATGLNARTGLSGAAGWPAGATCSDKRVTGN
jgi:hypothetical protein